MESLSPNMFEKMISGYWRIVFAVLLLVFTVPNGYAHSGKARFHAIIDTDGAADDLRALCMLLGNREVEVLAITASEGALPPVQTAGRVAALLRGFHHEGIPVGAGRSVDGDAPSWRAHSEQVNWGDTIARDYPSAAALLAETLENEEERAYFIALGALTNLSDLLNQKPDLRDRIEQVVWYNSQAEPLDGANYQADTLSALRVLKSGVPVTVVSANPAFPVAVTTSLLDSIATVPTVYARKIVDTHRTAPLAQLIDAKHLEEWDDLVPVYLFAPELFVTRNIGGNVKSAMLPDQAAVTGAQAELLAILRGKPDTESRVFYGFPVQHDLYASEVVPMIDQAIEKHGPSEWRAGVLTNELHGHLGIYATIGVKMGIRAREYFNIGVDDILVTSYAGHKPPISCMNDGLQVSTGATVGHGLITIAEARPPKPEARFSFKGKTILLKLKPEYAERIRKDVKRGIELYGDLTEAYWQYVKELALQYWLDFDRYEIFDMQVEDEGEKV